MMCALLILLLPVCLFAQVNFEPIRLDDSLDTNFYYPQLLFEESGDMLCTWTSASYERVAIHGQWISPHGGLIGERIVYQNISSAQAECVPKFAIRRSSAGGELQTLYDG